MDRCRTAFNDGNIFRKGNVRSLWFISFIRLAGSAGNAFAFWRKKTVHFDRKPSTLKGWNWLAKKLVPALLIFSFIKTSTNEINILTADIHSNPSGYGATGANGKRS
jgi:hypothetical protein